MKNRKRSKHPPATAHDKHLCRLAPTVLVKTLRLPLQKAADPNDKSITTTRPSRHSRSCSHMAKLVCQTGPKAGHEYPLSKDIITMGRQSSCDVQILDNMSSRAHCQVRRDGKLYSLVDLGSRNGTYLNDKKVSERQLVFGDRIRIGEAEYKLVKEPGDVELKDLLSKYEVQEKIGEGGMGIVYKANQKSMNRIVALKILSPKYSSKQRFVEQFIKEARAAGALNHPHIIQVHDVGTENDIHYFSMEYVDGLTCMQALREQGMFKVGDALEVTKQTAKALEYAHSQRLIHQDIKPDNIMIGDNNQVKLADLGISKTFDEVESEEGPKRVMGTPHYMAPEAALGKKIDHRVDIYSLGATLYHLLTGKTPFTGTSATEVLKAHVMDPLPAIQDMNPDVPDDVCALVERMLAKKPDDRYHDAADIVTEISRLQQGLGLSSERIGSGETMMLRRYVSGEKTSGEKAGGEKISSEKSQQTPVHTTQSRTPRYGDNAATTAERIIRGKDSNSLLIKGGVFFTIALILFIVGWRVLSGTSGAGSTLRVPAPVPELTQKPTAPSNPSVPQHDNPHAQALSALEERLRSGSDQLDLAALREQVEELRGQLQITDQRNRARLLIEKIGTLQQERRLIVLEQSFQTLRSEVTKLASEHNYELAVQRIQAFAHKDEIQLSSKVQTLKDEVARTKSNYLSGLKLKIQNASAQKSLTKLKELRDQLPAPLLGSEAENDIAKAIKTIEDQQQTDQLAVIKQATDDFINWDFSAVETLAEQYRAAMGTTENGKRLSGLADASKKLTLFISDMRNQLAAASRRPRYRGTLEGWTDPDLLNADSNGIQIEIASGGIVVIKWPELPSDALQTIAKLVLTKEQYEKYQSALDSIIAAQGNNAK
jgi:serine/threonine protein kinase